MEQRLERRILLMTLTNYLVESGFRQVTDKVEDEMDCIDFDNLGNHKRGEQRRTNIVKIQGYVNTALQYDQQTFKSHFRLNKSTISELVGIVGSQGYTSTYIPGKEQVSCIKAVLLTVWYLANTETYRQISDRFDVSYSTAHNVLKKILDILVSLRAKYIRWPTVNEMANLSQQFKKKKGFPHVVGAIDGCHVAINRPEENEESYVNRKGYHSLLIQAVALPNKLFSDIYCGEPGSMHDARLLRKSSIFKYTEKYNFGGNVLLGDSAYPNNSWLVTPFKEDGRISPSQRKFNYIHSATRIVVEHAFGLLKGRFRRLFHVNNLDINLCVSIIMAACVLHNICILTKDDAVIALPDLSDALISDRMAMFTPKRTRREEIFAEIFSQKR